MSWAKLIAWIAYLGLGFVNKLFDQNAERRKVKEAALKEAQEGIKQRDASAITAAFDRFNNA